MPIGTLVGPKLLPSINLSYVKMSPGAFNPKFPVVIANIDHHGYPLPFPGKLIVDEVCGCVHSYNTP